MLSFTPKYCLICASLLVTKWQESKERLCCSDLSCKFVLWNNPIPVVGGIIETEEGVVLCHNRLWPTEVYSLITGFVDTNESPTDAILRELKEELGLVGFTPSLVGIYPYTEQNQIIIVYHIKAEGQIILSEEIDAVKLYTKEQLNDWPFGQENLPGWPFGCGWAIGDWLKGKNL